MDMRFASLLAKLLDRQGFSQRAFAREVGVIHSVINKVVNDLRPPPEDFHAWADVLGLDDEERERFVEAGYLRMCPEFIRERYLAMKDGRVPEAEGGRN